MEISVSVPDGEYCEDCPMYTPDLCRAFDIALHGSPSRKCLSCRDSEIFFPRWRAKVDEIYYLLNSSGDVEVRCDDRDGIDHRHFDAGNYFRSTDKAEAAAAEIRAILVKYKEEI